MADETRTAPLVRLKNASVTRGGARLLDGVDFRLEAGARWALLGQNGAGKTTLLRLLRGDIPPDSGPDGEARLYDLPGAGGPQATPLGLRQRLALVSGDMQDLYARHEWAVTGLDAVLTGFFDTPLLYAEPSPAQRGLAQATLASLGLEHLAERRVARMSSGQARSILLARALACQPDALLLDEGLEGLDAPARRGFLTLLDRVATDNPALAVIFCSHRAAQAQELPACLGLGLLLEAGRVCASGLLREVLARMQAEAAAQTTHWRLAAPDQPNHAGQPGQSHVPNQADQSNQPDQPNHAGQPNTHGQARQPERQAFPAPESRCASAADRCDFLVRITNADVVLDGAPILHDISWTLRPGEHWAVLGPNGAGKSTLLGLLAGDFWPSALSGPPGLVEYGFAPPGETLDETRRRIGRVSPALDSGYGVDLRVDEAVWSGAFGSVGLFAQAEPAVREVASRLLEFFGLTQLAARRIRSLSRGQLRRVMLARAVMATGADGPGLLLLDEPMAGLDARTRRAARELLARLAETGTPLVVVTHHERDLPGQVNRVLELHDGRVLFCGDREEYERRQASRAQRNACRREKDERS